MANPGSIGAPVGVGQPNRREDVFAIQSLLNRAAGPGSEASLLKQDGLFGPKTEAALRAFQQEKAKLTHSDGIVDLNQRTLHALKSGRTPHTQSAPNPSPITQARKELPLFNHPQSASLPKSSAAQVHPEDATHRVLLHSAKSTPQRVNTSAWISRVLPSAKVCKATWRIPIAVTISQGALESKWGTVPVAKNNYFGIQGESIHGSTLCPTHEERHGVLKKELHPFRNYLSLEESVDDFGKFLNVNHRYRAAFSHVNEPEEFFMTIARAGYATNHKYQKLVLTVMRSHGIEDHDHA